MRHTGKDACPPVKWALRALAIVLLFPAVAFSQSGMAEPAEIAEALKVLDHWRGRWNVTLTTTRPQASTATSVTTNTWVLNGRFMQGDSGEKSDGTRDMSMMTFDAVARVYPLWVFTSGGVVFYLAEGRWDEATRTMLWDSPTNLAGSYRYRCRFPDDDTFQCKSVVKDWKGSVLLDLEAAGTRVR